MKRFILVVSIFKLTLPTIVKAEGHDSFYLGAGITGVNKINNEPTFVQETKGISYVSEITSEKKPTLDTELFLGYRVNKNYAIELSYDAENRSNLYTATGFATNDNRISKNPIPYKSTLESRFSALQFSVIGEKEICDYFSIFGRVGMTHSRTKWERRVNFDNQTIPNQNGTSSSTKISTLLGLGLSKQVANHIYLRTEVVKSLGLNGVIPKIAVIYSF